MTTGVVLVDRVTLTVTRLGLAAAVPLGYLADFIYLASFDAIRRLWLQRRSV